MRFTPLDFEIPVSTEKSIEGLSSELARCEAFMRRELPGRVRGELETRIERALVPVEESLKQQLVGIVQDLQVRLFEEFKLAYRQGILTRKDGNVISAGDTSGGVPDNLSKIVCGPVIQDSVAFPNPESYVLGNADMEESWGVSQPMDLVLASYPFAMDDPAAFLDDVTQQGENWDS